MHSENAQFHTVVSFCSGGEFNVKCVHTALEMEASKEDQRDVVSFLVLEHAIKSKRPGILSDGNIVLHDNARPHTVNVVRGKLQTFGWETLQHPPYSPYLSYCDFHILDELKKDIHGHRFHSDEELQEWVGLWIHQRPISFCKTGIDHLVSQWNKCINTSGNYL